MSEQDKAAAEVERRLKLLALQVVIQLPANQTEAIATLEFAKALVTDFMAPEKPALPQRAALHVIKPIES